MLLPGSQLTKAEQSWMQSRLGIAWSVARHSSSEGSASQGSAVRLRSFNPTLPHEDELRVVHNDPDDCEHRARCYP
jgi:hypothetical protein